MKYYDGYLFFKASANDQNRLLMIFDSFGDNAKKEKSLRYIDKTVNILKNKILLK